MFIHYFLLSSIKKKEGKIYLYFFRFLGFWGCLGLAGFSWVCKMVYRGRGFVGFWGGLGSFLRVLGCSGVVRGGLGSFLCV